MKNLVLNILIAVAAALFAKTVSAVDFTTSLNEVRQDTVLLNTVKEISFSSLSLAQNEIFQDRIDISELPQPVKSAVAPRYAAYAIQQAYKGNNMYKLLLVNAGLKLIVFYDANGNFLQEETVKSVKTVVLV